MANDTKVYGMPAETGRWAFVLAGLIMNLCLGTVYAWSVFRKPLQDLFSTPEVKITATQTLWPFMLFLAFFTVLMPISGRLLQRVHPRILSIIGSVIVGAGWILSRYAHDMNFLYLTYGVIAGAGVGIVYGIPIAVVTRWFPDMKGIALGITVLGFGVSALITAPMAVALIKADGILLTFLYLGLFFLVALVLLSLVFQFPPAGWQPKGWQAATGTSSTVDFTPSEMLKTSSSWGLWLCFIIGSLSGLMAIGISSPVGQEIIKVDAATAATLVSFFAIFNGGGRPVFGWLTDAIGPGNAAAVSAVLVLSASLLMIFFAGEGHLILYAWCFACFWAALGSWLAIAPTATATFFGIKNSANNYGVIFSAYGIGAIAAGLIAGQARDVFGSYIYAFYVTAGLAALGIIIALTLMKPPKKVYRG